MTTPGALAESYASGDVFLHVNDREPFGIGPLEAMASGVPVVVPNAGGVLSYANDSNCWLADPAVDALARAVVGALARPDPARLARAAETAARFDWGRVTPQIFATYDGLRERALT
ncbi:MAG: glycosyltransferase, partial [Luteitalea sp.]